MDNNEYQVGRANKKPKKPVRRIKYGPAATRSHGKGFAVKFSKLWDGEVFSVFMNGVRPILGIRAISNTKKVARQIELGDRIPEMHTIVQDRSALKTICFEIEEEVDLADHPNQIL